MFGDQIHLTLSLISHYSVELDSSHKTTRIVVRLNSIYGVVNSECSDSVEGKVVISGIGVLLLLR